ncbi:MAG: site-specific integrase [bacterium]|nr:site-specific integrase [bacterium]
MRAQRRRMMDEEKLICRYQEYLIQDEKSKLTIEKYLRDLRKFFAFTKGKSVTKEVVISYKEELMKKYAVKSVNSMLVALNRFLDYMNWHDCKVKLCRVQREVFCEEDKELKRCEYVKLIQAANRTGKQRLSLLIQTICATGIRVSELQFITVEAIHRGHARVQCKGKNRVILIPRKLRKALLSYVCMRQMKRGPVFVTKHGNPLHRSNIWREMKNLCIEAHISETKVFPHNLRHLFAQTFYEMDKDIVKLADMLGHSNIETTRIYIVSSGEEHQKCIDKMELLL